VRPNQEAVFIRPADGGYRVGYAQRATGSLDASLRPPQREIQARRVIVAGGAIGTAGLLLRSRPYLPRLSDQLGRNLSGNGDLALMALLPTDKRLPGRGLVEQHKGVAMDTVCYEFLESHGFSIITQHQLSVATLPNGDPDDLFWGLRKKRMMRHYGTRMLGLAVLGIDGSPGQVFAAPTGDELTISPAFGVSLVDFPLDDRTRQLYADARRICGELVERMGGRLIDLTMNPSPSHEETSFFAHPLGTARMADGPGMGVVNADGEVFGHPGLFVADGAAVPTALGVNPSLTIAALAERVGRRLVRRLGGKPVDPPDPNPSVVPRPREGADRRRAGAL
jgi:cholesterol oxidase